MMRMVSIPCLAHHLAHSHFLVPVEVRYLWLHLSYPRATTLTTHPESPQALLQLCWQDAPASPFSRMAAGSADTLVLVWTHHPWGLLHQDCCSARASKCHQACRVLLMPTKDDSRGHSCHCRLPKERRAVVMESKPAACPKSSAHREWVVIWAPWKAGHA